MRCWTAEEIPHWCHTLYMGLVAVGKVCCTRILNLDHTPLLNKVEFKAFHLINSPPLTDCLQSLKNRRNVASLSIFYRYFHGYCSSELANCMPPPLRRPRCTRLSTYSHPFSVQPSNARINQCLHSFIPFTGKLWNSLPDSVFPPTYDLQSFKRGVSRHLPP